MEQILEAVARHQLRLPGPLSRNRRWAYFSASEWAAGFFWSYPFERFPSANPQFHSSPLLSANSFGDSFLQAPEVGKIGFVQGRQAPILQELIVFPAPVFHMAIDERKIRAPIMPIGGLMNPDIPFLSQFGSVRYDPKGSAVYEP